MDEGSEQERWAEVMAGVRDVREMRPWDEAMSGWRSDFARARRQLDRQRTRLLGLVGQPILAAWTGWNPEKDQWFDGIPLVLIFDGGIQLELAWGKWDELSVTWNTIDLTVAPAIVGRPHEWRSSAPEIVGAVVGRTVTGFAVTEGPYFTDVDLTEFSIDDLPVHLAAGWVTVGLWIATGDTGLHVYNGMDANGLGSVPVLSENGGADRLTPLADFPATEDKQRPAGPGDADRLEPS